ncbi:MAG: phosphatidylglycerophosphatase A [Methylococcales bacterium]|nr:phosphatidylglycerophosphatase A [Methylococcales bacterium]
MNIFVNSEYGNNKLTIRQILLNPTLFLAFGFGSGLAKKMPGTMGTVAAIPVYLVCIQANFWLYSVLTVLACVIGVKICADAAKKLGEHDFGGIVWDEIAGYLVTMWFVPFSWHAVFLGFVLFRFFDILKPWPIKWIDQKLEGGLGIMLDDILAGLFSAVILLFII